MRAKQPPDCSDLEGHHIGPMTEERVARISKALAHPERIRILRQFESREPHIAREIVGESTLAQSTVSEHLRIMREAGVLLARKDGPRTWYCLNRRLLELFSDTVHVLASEHLAPVSRLAYEVLGAGTR